MSGSFLSGIDRAGLFTLSLRMEPAQETPREETANEKPLKKPRSKPPLKLCFKPKIDVGRSDIVPFRPRSYVHYVTRKFYTPDYSVCSKETYEKVKEEFENEPKKKYGYPVLESHRYGWYSDVSFQDPDLRQDKRLHFPKTVNPLFQQPFFKLTL